MRRQARLIWQPLKSKLLATVAYVAEKSALYLRFRSGELYRYLTFPAAQHQEFLEAESQGHTSFATSEITSLRTSRPPLKSPAIANQDDVSRTLTFYW